MQANHPSSAPNYYDLAGNLRTGDRISSVLLTGKENAPDNYRFAYSYGGDSENWTTPRHHHNFEQVRYCLSGDYSIGKDKVLPSGWVGYFPESAYYGPQEQSSNMTMLVLQFGGPSLNGFASVRQRRTGYDSLLAKGGKFENGVHTWIDEKGQKHNQDAFEAVWEHMYGKKIEYPKPRFADAIIMNPQAYDWVKDPELRGVAHRRMGTFAEREVKIGFIRVEAGATLRFGVEKSVELMFLQEGKMSMGGKSFPQLSAFGTTADDSPVELRAEDPTELFYVKLPTFAKDERILQAPVISMPAA